MKLYRRPSTCQINCACSLTQVKVWLTAGRSHATSLHTWVFVMTCTDCLVLLKHLCPFVPHVKYKAFYLNTQCCLVRTKCGAVPLGRWPCCLHPLDTSCLSVDLEAWVKASNWNVIRVPRCNNGTNHSSILRLQWVNINIVFLNTHKFKGDTTELQYSQCESSILHPSNLQ